MVDNTSDENDTPRIKIKNLPRPEEELGADEQKKIQGGATRIVRSMNETESYDGSGKDFIER